MIQGKGLYIYVGSKCGTPAEAVQFAADLGCSWIAPRLAYSIFTIGANPSYPNAQMYELITRAHASDIQVWGWVYLPGGIRVNQAGQVFATGYATPEQEAIEAAELADLFKVDGLIINCEKEFKQYNQVDRARRLMVELRRHWSGLAALSSYRFPSLHPEFPWTEILSRCDVSMPQVYWNAGRSVQELDQSFAEWSAVRRLPFVPTGRAYGGEGFPDPTPAETNAFLRGAHDRSTPGCSFWSMDKLRSASYGPAIAAAIKAFPWKQEEPEPIELTIEEMVRRLWAAHPELAG